MLSESSTFNSFLNESIGKRIVGFGADQRVFEITHILSSHNLTIEYFVDNDLWKWGGKQCGIPIFSPAKLKCEALETVTIIICSGNPFEIEKQLCTMGISKYYAFCLWVELIHKNCGTPLRLLF